MNRELAMALCLLAIFFVPIDSDGGKPIFASMCLLIALVLAVWAALEYLATTARHFYSRWISP